MKKEKIQKISNVNLEKILLKELEGPNDNDIGISKNLRNVIGKLPKEEKDLATIAGFKSYTEIKSIINS